MPNCENCARLQQRIRELEDELQQAYATQQDIDDRASEASRRASIAESNARRAQQEAEDAEYFRQDQTKALQRAREYGDSYSEQKAIEKLKRGW